MTYIHYTRGADNGYGTAVVQRYGSASNRRGDGEDISRL